MSHLASHNAMEGVQKAIVAKCDEALDSVSGRTVSAKDIHAARKALKKARAFYGWLAPGIGQREFREQNHALRDAARPLSATGSRASTLLDRLRNRRARQAMLDSAPVVVQRALETSEAAVGRRLA